MFPLGSVLLPGEHLPLHIFEPRYQALVHECLKQDDPSFGVVLIARGHEAGGGDVRHDVATTAHIIGHEAIGSGRYLLECVGGDVLLKSIDALAPGGMLMIYGRASGDLPPLPAEQIFARNLHVIGLNIGGQPWNQAHHRNAIDEILDLVAEGRIKPVISKVFPMARVVEVHNYLSDRKTMGKVVLVPSD